MKSGGCAISTIANMALNFTLDQIKTARIGIKNTHLRIPLSTYMDLRRVGAIQIADFNRDQVTTRPGSSSELLLSISIGFSIGSGAGYWNGLGDINPTPLTPIRVTDFGHRTRWIDEIRELEALIDSQSIAMIQISDNELYTQIMDTPIYLDVKTHTSGTVPEWYVKAEYSMLNRTGCPLTVGEILRASTDEAHMGLVNSLEFVLTNTRKPKGVREKSLAVFNAMVNGMLYGSEKMTTKSSDMLVDHSNLTTAQKDKASKIIRLIGEIENSILEELNADVAATSEALLHDKQNAVLKANKKEALARHKRFVSRDMDLAFDGPIVHALTQGTDADHVHMSNAIKEFYTTSLATKESWSRNVARVCNEGPNNKARNYNALRYALTPVAKTLFSGLLVDSAWRASVIGRAMAHVGWLRVFAVVQRMPPWRHAVRRT